MLRIYNVCVELVREVAVLVEQIARRDRDQARQLRRSMISVVLNVAEGSGDVRERFDQVIGTLVKVAR